MIYKISKKNFFETFISFCLALCCIFSILFLENNVSSLKYIGWLIILTSIFMIYKYRNVKSISLMIGTIALISISFSYSICFNTYNTAFNWQVALIQTSSNIINAKNFLVFLISLLLAIGNISGDKENLYKEATIFNYNPLIAFGCVFVLIYAFLFGLDRGTIGSYSSNTNALYEYAIIVFVFAWQYAKKNKLFKYFLIAYAFLYCFQGLLYGDRSSGFPMIILILIFMCKNKIKMKNVIIIGFVGILFANLIDIFRTSGNLFTSANMKEIFNRGLFVNTISYSFYGGTQAMRYGLVLPFHDKIQHMFNYLLSIIVGNSGRFNLTSIARQNGFLNKGGGMSSTYFYFWGGFIGTIIFAFIVGKIIKYVFSHDTKLTNIFKVTITVFTIRWFVYYPIAFFRTALFIPFVCYYLFNLFNNMLLKKRK